MWTYFLSKLVAFLHEYVHVVFALDSVSILCFKT